MLQVFFIFLRSPLLLKTSLAVIGLLLLTSALTYNKIINVVPLCISRYCQKEISGCFFTRTLL